MKDNGMAKKAPNEVSIGKFDLLATVTYAKGLLDGLDDEEARRRGMVAAVMGAKAKLGHTSDHGEGDVKSLKEGSETKKKSTITAESFKHQVSGKMGTFFAKTFLPTIRKLVKTGLTYDELERLLNIPATWGAKISGEQFVDRASRLKT
jgi:hypothetical protein